MNKSILRKKFINILIEDVNCGPVIDNALSIIEKFDPKVIGLYIAHENEIDISSLIVKCPNRRFAVPKIKSEEDEIFFVNYSLSSILQPNERYIKYYEPVSDIQAFPEVIFVPALAFDIKGNRLGRGRGHYDKYFAKHAATKIGVTTGASLIQKLPYDIHDIKMNWIITENFILSL